MKRRRVGFVACEGVQALDFVGPADVFGSDALLAAPYANSGGPPYEITVIGVDRTSFAASNGVRFWAHDVLPAAIELDTLIIPGGVGMRAPGVPERVAAWVNDRACDVRRIASVCTGIYPLALTGLVNGERVATHWACADDVEQRFPALRVDREARVRRHGNVWTSGGVSAGVDLALAMVRDDLGADAARDVAHEMVWPSVVRA
jgi:transcriptional regulator GlxA family with amidase domain